MQQHWETLPWHSRSKWTERNNKSKIATERIADFEEFSQFVRQQAKLAIVPVFSEESVSKPHEGEKGIGIHLKFGGRSLHIRKETTLATGLNQGNMQQPHNLKECGQFVKKTPTERREFVAEKKLCFGCFSDQHIAKSCKKTCKLATSPTQRHCTITIGRRN